MTIENDQFRRIFLLLLVIGISLAFVAIIQQFIVPLVLAAIFAGLAMPMQRRLARAIGGRRNLAASLILLGTILLVAIPVSAFLGVVVSQAIDVNESAVPWIEEQLATPGAVESIIAEIPFGREIFPDPDEVMGKVAEFASAAGRYLAGSVVEFSQGTARFFLLTFVMLYAFFYFLVDGARVLDRILYYIPLTAKAEDDLVDRFFSVSRAVLKGSLIIAVLQGVLAGLAFWVLGVPGAAFWTTVMIILSIIPAIGSALIWIPAVVYLWATGHAGAAIGLGLWCGLVVGSIDNFLRPMLVGKDTKMPDLLVLLGTLGGIYLFGVAGFILGPIVAALFLAVWEQYAEAFADRLPPTSRQLAAESRGAAEAG